MRIVRSLTAVATALALVTPVTAAAKAPYDVPRINWGSCGAAPELAPFQCASVEVPTDYDRPNGPTTTIALTRLPAADPAQRVGSLFINPGGPGAPGVPFVQQIASSYSPQLRARFDIVGFDPRGVGLSDPATCYPTAAEEAVVLAKLKDFPVTAAEERGYIADAAKLAASCRRTSPDRLRHMSTANVARDLDLLRRAVGDAKLSYLGYSYGTFLAATYAKLFPNNVRALVMDGTLVPERYTGSNGERLPVGARYRQGEAASDSYQQFLLECKKAAAACPLNALGDPRTVVENLLERLKTKPIGHFDYPTTVGYMFGSFYSSTTYPALAQQLAELATSATSAKAVRKEDYPSIGNALQPCIETRNTGRPLSYPAYADAADGRAPHFGRFRAWIGIHCEFLGLKDQDAYFAPWPNQVRRPVLIFGTRHDPGTPYEATRPFANLWPDARMVTIEGWGHATSLGASKCADRLLTTYLSTLQAPSDGSTCQQDRKPFDPLPAGKSVAGLIR
ncbi:alpha/beta fold hydrolase [Kribbella sandramycini]|uniref:Alpha/beta fold hydrolase n=1 Tax=Kribbella sandramycini TaxID=60450 RepID=A0A7Y4KX33_9ACTN|nr:alpha/beta hydrolase [Kribbella sandramycini]MBB6567914.1 pimeloyl-ACP methyl ester carboxylesterase [Kribbella sandramycini]NOL39491.1 alpha/beta fold hydrolase [Kribbella sandramycini]